MNSNKQCIFSIEYIKEIFKPTCVINNDFILLNSFEEIVEAFFIHPCKIDAYVGAIITNGRVKLRIDLDEFEFGEGTLLMVPPEKFVQLINIENIEAKAFLVSDLFFQEINLDLKNILPLQIELLRRSFLKLSQIELNIVLQYFTLIEATATSSSDRYYKDTLFKLGGALAFYIGSLIYKQENKLLSEISNKTRGEKIYIHFMDLIAKYHRKERSVGFYSDKLSITPKYLTTLIKKISGKSAAQWIDEFVILEAKSLLKYSDMSIQQIGYELNFPTQSFFGKFFKHHTGMTPGAYRSSETEKSK